MISVRNNLMKTTVDALQLLATTTVTRIIRKSQHEMQKLFAFRDPAK